VEITDCSPPDDAFRGVSGVGMEIAFPLLNGDSSGMIGAGVEFYRPDWDSDGILSRIHGNRTIDPGTVHR
jgi:hypothetical protein